MNGKQYEAARSMMTDECKAMVKPEALAGLRSELMRDNSPIRKFDVTVMSFRVLLNGDWYESAYVVPNNGDRNMLEVMLRKTNGKLLVHTFLLKTDFGQ